MSEVDKIFSGFVDHVNTSLAIAPKVTATGFKGKHFRFKTPPRNILEYAEDIAGFSSRRGGIDLSDPQKEVLVGIWGVNPEIWDNTYDTIVMGIGQGGGKNVIAEISAGFAAYYLSNCEDPYQVIAAQCEKLLARTGDFEISNSSMASGGQQQAKSVFFDRVKKVLRATKYEDENFFSKYMGLDLREEGLGDMKLRTIEFPSFGEDTGKIRFHSLDSTPSAPEGKTLILSFEDEPSRAETQAPYLDAKKLHKVVTANTQGRFPNGIGKTVVFSYFNTSEYDLTYELIKAELDYQQECKDTGKEYKSKTKVYTFSTYDFNPAVKKEDKATFYRDDLIDAEARFDSIKSKSKYAFFNPHVEKIKECAITDIQNRVTYTPVEITKQFPDGTSKLYIGNRIDEIKGDKKYRCWAMDASASKDRFYITSGYAENLTNTIESIEYISNQEKLLLLDRRVIMDLIIEWRPSKSHPVDFKNVLDVFQTLLDAFPNSQTFKADKWNTALFAAILESRGIKSTTYIFSRKQQLEWYKNVRTAIINNVFNYIYHALFIEELERVQLINGVKIEEPVGFNKDCSDCGVLLYDDLSSKEFTIMNTTTSLDRARDEHLINLVDKMIIQTNVATQKGIFNVDEYLKEKLFLTDKELKLLKEAQNEYFPN